MLHIIASCNSTCLCVGAFDSINFCYPLKHEIHGLKFKDSVPASQLTLKSIIQTNWLMLAREIISGYNGNGKLLHNFVAKRWVANVNGDGTL